MKKLLMTPGPTPIPEQISLKMAQPMIHHRTKEFIEMFNETIELTKKLFKTKNDIVIFSSSGTGAMEASVSNIMEQNDNAIVVNAGKFGERWVDLVKTFSANPIVIKKEYGDYVQISDIDNALRKNKYVKALYMQACETSTGVFHPIEEIGRFIKEKYPEIVFVVDGITAIGAIDINVDAIGIDMMIAGSQKALMLPPGLSIISISEKAKQVMQKNSTPKYYFNILSELNSNAGHFTPSVSLILGLRESLKMIINEVGLNQTFKRHKLLANATREAVKALGLGLFAKRPSDSLTAVKSPEGLNSKEIIDLMRTYGIEIANGQGSMKGKIFRIAHLGYFDKSDILSCISVLEMVLKKLGINKNFGYGIKKAMEALIE